MEPRRSRAVARAWPAAFVQQTDPSWQAAQSGAEKDACDVAGANTAHDHREKGIITEQSVNNTSYVFSASPLPTCCMCHTTLL
eukprot:296242-Amphidinium_carterae.1